MGAAGRRLVHLELCRHALGKWTEFVSAAGPIIYVDSVVGLRHEVEANLPLEAFKAASDGSDPTNISERYDEPLSALQDDDLEFDNHIEYAWYAIYNLFQKYALASPIDDWLIVNQALSSETDPERWNTLLSDAIDAAGEEKG